jgi:hypothetical protein
MITKITAGLLALTLLAACETTKTTQRTTLREMNATRLASADTTSTNMNEPAPPAEGPEDIPAEGPRDLNRNPALVPSPLLRVNAAGQP